MASLDVPTLIDEIVSRLHAAYIFPDRAAEAERLLRANLAEGKYPEPVSEELCQVINEDLFAASVDKHLRLIWHQANEDTGESPQSDEELIAALREMFRVENYGIRRVERLGGNVGLIALTIIPEASTAGDPFAAAMRLVQHTNGLILDLRPTLGGAPDGVALLASFFFSDGEVQLSDIIEGPNGPARQFWTSGYLSGPRYLDRPVYVLVSGKTFSGGEALAYDLQALGRVTVVGEVTRGGAHPSTVVSLGDNVELRLPIARSVSPITGTNWEGVGVTPDVAVAADAALQTAHMAILDQLLAGGDIPAAVREEAKQARG
ncbi:MAG TPA: S41 family peptidase [Candidatus Dormibacteraeota bacterium]